MRRPVRLGHEHPHIIPHDLAGLIAEDALGCRVEGLHDAAFVDYKNGVGCRIDDRTPPLLACLEQLFALQAFFFVLDECLRCPGKRVERVVDFRHSRGRKRHGLVTAQGLGARFQGLDRLGNVSRGPGREQDAQQRHQQAHEACDEKGLPDRRFEHVFLAAAPSAHPLRGEMRVVAV